MRILYFLVALTVTTLVSGMEQPQPVGVPGAHNIRNRIMNMAVAAIHGLDTQPSLDNDADLCDKLKDVSPEEFIKQLRANIYENTKLMFTTKGFRPDEVDQSLITHMAKQYPVAHRPHAKGPSPKMRRIALRATSTMQGPPMRVVCDNTSKDLACIDQNTMIVNENMLEKDEMSTPKKIAALARHEKSHAEAKDQNFRAAFDELLGKRKSNPNSPFSPDSQRLRAIVSRTGEVFADLRSASESLEAAKEQLRLARQFKAKYKDGKFDTHPSYHERVKLAELMVEFHWYYSQQEPKKDAQSKKSPKRRLLERLEQAFQEPKVEDVEHGLC